jgi:hypothetical protein
MDTGIYLHLIKPLATCFTRLRAHTPSHGALADGSRAHGHLGKFSWCFLHACWVCVGVLHASWHNIQIPGYGQNMSNLAWMEELQSSRLKYKLQDHAWLIDHVCCMQQMISLLTYHLVLALPTKVRIFCV